VLVIMLGVVLAAVPGTLVADPFCGSGKVPAACKRLGRRGLACEIEPQDATPGGVTRCQFLEFPESNTQPSAIVFSMLH